MFAICPDCQKYVVAVSTGHAALHLSLLMIGVGPGDEVISSSIMLPIFRQYVLGAEPVCRY